MKTIKSKAWAAVSNRPYGWAMTALASLGVLLGGLALTWHHGVVGADLSPPPIARNRPQPTPDVSTPPVPVETTAAPAACAIPRFPQAAQVGWIEQDGAHAKVRPCQALTPAEPYPVFGVDSASCGGCGEPKWPCMGPLPFQAFAQGEYVGPYRAPHVAKYRLRVDDQLDMVYRLTRRETASPYELNVGDTIRVESLTDDNLDRAELLIQPDGMITLRLLGQVRAARKTVDELREELEEAYKKFYKFPAVTVTPLTVNTRLEDLRATVDSRQGIGGQGIRVRIAPDGTLQLPGLNSVPAQGLTLEELKAEIDARYEQEVHGIEVTPILSERAPRFAYVLGEVQTPGRYELNGPTTVSQSIALAGGWRNGGNLRHIVIFRRAEDWRLLATRLDLNGALIGTRPCPSDEIWVRDSDVVLVPKSAILLTADFVDLVFQRCIYGVLPFQGVSIGLSSL